jgi:broad specificity phosphatase PhoE
MTERIRERHPMRVVHLLRHGEVWNPDHILYGRLDGFPLSPRGEEQAKAATEYLATRDIGFLVSSPLERAVQTARPVGELFGLSTYLDVRLIEAENKLQGRQVAGGKALLADPRNWRHFVNPFRPSWGEPYIDIAMRVLAAARAARDHAGDTAEAVCVSHQLPIVAARRYAEGRPLAHDPRRRQCALASVTSLTFSGDVVVRVDYAEPAGATPAESVAGA